MKCSGTLFGAACGLPRQRHPALTHYFLLVHGVACNELAMCNHAPSGGACKPKRRALRPCELVTCASESGRLAMLPGTPVAVLVAFMIIAPSWSARHGTPPCTERMAAPAMADIELICSRLACVLARLSSNLHSVVCKRVERSEPSWLSRSTFLPCSHSLL